MRTTLSLDDDVAARIKSEVRRSGKAFKEVVNDLLRAGLSERRRAAHHKPPFQIRARDLGACARG